MDSVLFIVQQYCIRSFKRWVRIKLAFIGPEFGEANARTKISDSFLYIYTIKRFTVFVRHTASSLFVVSAKFRKTVR